MHIPRSSLDLKDGNRLRSWFMFLSLCLASSLSFTMAHAAEIANVPDSMKSRLSTSTVGLTEQFGVTGRLVRLQGRFQSVTVAESSGNGQVKLDCLTPGPESIKALEKIEDTHMDTSRSSVPNK